MEEIKEPLQLPRWVLPEAPAIPRVTLDQPRGLIPSYRPLVVPPSDLRPPEGVKGVVEEEKTQQEQSQPKKQNPQIPSFSKEVTELTIPFTDINVPFPKQEILVAAGTTAAVSVVATLSATAIFKRCVQILKPLLQQVVKKVQSRLGKTPPSWSRQRLEQRRDKYVQGDYLASK